MELRLDSVPAHLWFPVPCCLPAGAEILPGKTKGRPVIQSGWLPGTTSVCFYFTNYRLNEWEKKTPCFVPRCSSFPLPSQSKKQSSRLCKAGANGSALARILTIVCFSLCTGTLSENFLWKSQSNMRRTSKFVLVFFFPLSDSERWIQASRCVLNYCDFPKIYSRAISFQSLCSGCHCVFLRQIVWTADRSTGPDGGWSQVTCLFPLTP